MRDGRYSPDVDRGVCHTGWVGDQLADWRSSGRSDEDEETAVQSPDGGTKITWGGPPVRAKTAKNRFHLDIAPPVGVDQLAEVQRLESLGARRLDIGQGDVSWVVMADPDGNEFCVLTPR